MEKYYKTADNRLVSVRIKEVAIIEEIDELCDKREKINKIPITRKIEIEDYLHTTIQEVSRLNFLSMYRENLLNKLHNKSILIEQIAEEKEERIKDETRRIEELINITESLINEELK